MLKTLKALEAVEKGIVRMLFQKYGRLANSEEAVRGILVEVLNHLEQIQSCLTQTEESVQISQIGIDEGMDEIINHIPLCRYEDGCFWHPSTESFENYMQYIKDFRDGKCDPEAGDA